jgi:hypothetical protein
MRKMIFVLLVAALLPTALFGQEKVRNNNIDFGLTCLLAVSDGTFAPGPGFAADWYNAKLFKYLGMGAFVDIVVPLVKAFSDSSVTNFGLTASVLVGPAYMLFDNGTVALPLTVGYHFDWVAGFPGSFIWSINMGVGANFDAVWRFGKRWHGYARIRAAYNFGGGGEFLMFPGLGVGKSF